MSGILERTWWHLCGTDVPSGEVKSFYWELFGDISLVAVSASTAKMLSKPHGFGEFTLVYFSVVNGWFLYTHHYAARFHEISRYHWILQCLFLLGLYGAALTAGNLAEKDQDLHKSTYLHFSSSMVLLRMAVFLMLTRVAFHIGRAAPFCALFAFFLGDSMLCYALAGVSDHQATLLLWTSAVVVELVIDLFVAVALTGSVQISFRLKTTMNRYWAVVLAPLGAIASKAFVRSGNLDAKLIFASALLIQTLFSLLYFALQESVYNYMRRQPMWRRGLLILLLKALGLALWTVAANLMIIASGDDFSSKEERHRADLFGLSVGGALMLYFGLRVCTGRNRDVGEVLWVLGCWVSLIMVGFIPPNSSPLMFLSFYALLVSFLNLVESWTNLSEARRLAHNQSVEQQGLLTNAGNNVAYSSTDLEP